MDLGTEGWSMLSFLDATITCTTYFSKLGDPVFHNNGGVFQQDNVPCLKEKLAEDWFEETWPPNFPDLSPIKHLLDWLDKQVHLWRPHLAVYRT